MNPFFTWLKSLFARRRIRRPVMRDVAGMTADTVGSDAATRQEIIDTSDKPLKPGQRRRTLRDQRLLPKPTGPHWGRKKVKVMDRGEADRLFSETLRTRDRNIRDLAPDLEQLRRLRLPEWTSEGDVASALDLTIKQLRHYSIHRQRDTTTHYVTFAIRKRSGGCRLIHAPKKRLKAIQRTLHELLVSKLPVSAFANGFRQGRSVASNAAPHVGKAVLIKLDIADCFPTIHFGRVRGLLIAYGYSYPVAQLLAVLMTEPPRQPVELDGKIYHVPVGPRVCVQGAPTSPGLCNALLRRLDHRLAGLARKHGFDYTRYADDLTFSGGETKKIKMLITVAARVAHEEGLPLNREKTRVLRAGQRQTVTGITVNEAMGLSRQERRRLRAALHRQALSKSQDPLKAQQLLGKLAYLRMINPAQAQALVKADTKDES
jgi:RNA-directed DNA polymerase